MHLTLITRSGDEMADPPLSIPQLLFIIMSARRNSCSIMCDGSA